MLLLWQITLRYCPGQCWPTRPTPCFPRLCWAGTRTYRYPRTGCWQPTSGLTARAKTSGVKTAPWTSYQNKQKVSIQTQALYFPLGFRQLNAFEQSVVQLWSNRGPECTLASRLFTAFNTSVRLKLMKYDTSNVSACYTSLLTIIISTPSVKCSAFNDHYLIVSKQTIIILLREIQC